MATHLQTTAPLAERVLLPGDPGRALRLAKDLIDEPKMFNHNRGLWGYSGTAKLDGRALTIQSTGMGGPSAAIVIHELISLGAQRLLRVGTCGALHPSLELGELLIATEAISDDGTSRALGAGERVAAAPGLLATLLRGAGTPAGAAVPTASSTATSSGPVVSTDLLYGAEDRQDLWRAMGARAVEMETATLFTLAARHRVQAAAVLLVTNRLDGQTPIDKDGLAAGEIRLGQAAVGALAQIDQQIQPT